ncbi:MAG: hypothetical protein ABIR06_00135 [Cyclobacteriaceae bacterium]
MQKKALTILVVLTTVILLSFTTANVSISEIKITVTSEKQRTFDMFQNSRTTKGLTTPYEIKLKTIDGKFIFKSTKLKSSLKIKVERDGKTALTAEWPIIVVLIDNDKLTTFGID